MKWFCSLHIHKILLDKAAHYGRPINILSYPGPGILIFVASVCFIILNNILFSFVCHHFPSSLNAHVYYNRHMTAARRHWQRSVELSIQWSQSVLPRLNFSLDLGFWGRRSSVFLDLSKCYTIQFLFRIRRHCFQRHLIAILFKTTCNDISLISLTLMKILIISSMIIVQFGNWELIVAMQFSIQLSLIHGCQVNWNNTQNISLYPCFPGSSW